MLRRLRRHLPPLALFGGLFLFGVSLLVLGTSATEEGATSLQPSSLTVANGTAVLTYRVGYYGYSYNHIEVAYDFPLAPGDAYFVRCSDILRIQRGEPPVEPLLAFTGLANNTFVVSTQTVADLWRLRYVDSEENRCAPGIAFQWEAIDGGPTANRPEVVATYHSLGLDGENFALLAVLMVGGALAALLGGLAWARASNAPLAMTSEEDSTVEALRASLERMGHQLERTRKILLLAGVLGIFLWYPFLIPWSWQQAARASEDATIPWVAAALTVLFLVVLTLLWAREFLRLDRELIAWRGRLGELRDREAHLLDELDREGG